MNANDVMTEGPVTIRATASVRDAIRLLQALEVRHLPVVDATGSLVGILSDRDFGALAMPHLLEGPRMTSFGGRLETPVSYIMNAAVFWVRPDTDVTKTIELMVDQKIGAVPVLSTDGALVGNRYLCRPLACVRAARCSELTMHDRPATSALGLRVGRHSCSANQRNW